MDFRIKRKDFQLETTYESHAVYVSVRIDQRLTFPKGRTRNSSFSPFTPRLVIEYRLRVTTSRLSESNGFPRESRFVWLTTCGSDLGDSIWIFIPHVPTHKKFLFFLSIFLHLIYFIVQSILNKSILQTSFSIF